MNQIYNPQHFDMLVKRVNECAGMTPKRAVDYLSKNACSWIDKKIDASAGAEKKFFEKCHNLVTSYVDGVTGGDIEVSGIKSLYKDLQEARTEWDQKLVADAARNAKNKTKEHGQTAAADEDDVPIEVLLQERPGFDHGEGAQTTFKKYAKFKKEIPSQTTKPYLAIRVPVLVVTSGIPNIVKLKATGMCDDLLFGYPILKNQLLVGLNHDWLKENFSQKAKKSILKDGKKDQHLDYASAVSHVTDEIKKRTNRNYIQMGDIHGFDSQNLHWAWLASDMDLRRLNGTTGVSTFSIKEWTLPFEAQVRKMKK